MTKILYPVSLECTVIRVSHEKLEKLDVYASWLLDKVHVRSWRSPTLRVRIAVVRQSFGGPGLVCPLPQLPFQVWKSCKE